MLLVLMHHWQPLISSLPRPDRLHLTDNLCVTFIYLLLIPWVRAWMSSHNTAAWMGGCQPLILFHFIIGQLEIGRITKATY